MTENTKLFLEKLEEKKDEKKEETLVNKGESEVSGCMVPDVTGLCYSDLNCLYHEKKNLINFTTPQ